MMQIQKITEEGSGRSRSCWRGLRLAVVLLVLLATCTLVAPAGAQADPWAKGVHIPVIINLYPSSGVTEQQARDSVAAASTILAQANTHLHVVKVNNENTIRNHPVMPGGGDDGNGRFNNSEQTRIRQFGGLEINGTKNQKGIKVAFGLQPDQEDFPDSPGVSWHLDPTIMVLYRGSAALTGETIAHEIGHVLTLSGTYNINATLKANAAGHAPDITGPWGKNNFMAPSNRRNGTNITSHQILEMAKKIILRAKCVEQMKKAYPAEKVALQFGFAQDALGDQGGMTVTRDSSPEPGGIVRQSGGPQPYHDLHQVSLASRTDNNDVTALLMINGVMPSDEEIQAQYTVGLDSDANTGTGVFYAGLAGVDRIVRVTASGNQNAGTFTVGGDVVDPVTGTLTPLAVPPVVATEFKLPDIEEPGDEPVPAATSVDITIPKASLGITTVEVPVVATAGDSAMPYDTAFLTFDMERWKKDPTLTTFGTGVPTAGEPYPVALARLAPGSPFTLYLDETPVLTGTLDGSGAYSGSFVFPSNLPTDTIHFLTAQDSTGEFAYSITCPGETAPPPPPPPPPPDTWNLTPVNDTFVDAGFTRYCNQRIPVREATFGSSSALSVVRGRVDGLGGYLYWQGSLVQFDLSKAPAGFTKADLVLTMTRSANEPISVHRMLSPWEEEGACFTRPCSTCSPWASGWENRENYVVTPTDTVHVMGKKGTTIAWDVTADVQAMRAGTPNHGWFLRSAARPGATDITQTSFCSREAKGCAPVLRFTA